MLFPVQFTRTGNKRLLSLSMWSPNDRGLYRDDWLTDLNPETTRPQPRSTSVCKILGFCFVRQIGSHVHRNSRGFDNVFRALETSHIILHWSDSRPWLCSHFWVRQFCRKWGRAVRAHRGLLNEEYGVHKLYHDVRVWSDSFPTSWCSPVLVCLDCKIVFFCFSLSCA